MKLVQILKKPLRIVKRQISNSHVRRAYEESVAHYDNVISSIKAKGKKQLDFAAFVVFESCYGISDLFDRMLENPKWNPKVVIIPDVSRGIEHQKKSYDKAKQYFINKYGSDKVIDGWNENSNEYYDIADNFDMIYFANPYDGMVHRHHSIEYASKKNVLPIYISYGYDICTATTQARFRSIALNVVWKCFADTVFSYDDFKKYMINKGENVYLVGYSKMDSYHQYNMSPKKRKKILISPHHTIKMDYLPLSNFLRFYNLILKLPEMFPDIDFVFRPHPLLFTNLINLAGWKQSDVDEYLEKLKKNNIEYSSGGDYLQLFAECDAIINDCGSYTVEWLFTGKPGCFVYSPELRPELLTKLMNESISQYNIAKSEDDIINFVKQVEQAESKNSYEVSDWVKENIMINYPDVTSAILKEINIL